MTSRTKVKVKQVDDRDNKIVKLVEMTRLTVLFMVFCICFGFFAKNVIADILPQSNSSKKLKDCAEGSSAQGVTKPALPDVETSAAEVEDATST